MTENTIIQIIGLFFLINTLNHFFFSKRLERYALQRGQLSPGQSVKFAALLMGAGGIGLLIEPFQRIASLLLIGFLIIAAGTLHKFWQDQSNKTLLLESARFTRNLLLAGVLTWLVFL